jgi:energy-coupling factor transport system ATP-binding protein
VQVEGLTHTYAPGTPLEKRALDGVSMRIAAGEWVGIVGESGSGKTTLVQHLNGLLNPTGGRIFIGGTDLGKAGLSRNRVRQSVGMVFQYPENQFFEETVYDEISFVLRTRGGLSPEEIRQRVLASCRTLGLDFESLSSRSPFQLSGGEMRRVALASVLVQDPQLLILDEPTLGLDPIGKQLILQAIDRLHGAGKTVILIAHEIEDLLNRASRFIVMHRGRIWASGPPSEVFLALLQSEEQNLLIPSPFRLLQALRNSGWKIPAEVIGVEAALPYLDGHLRQAKHRGGERVSPGP